MYEKRCEAYCGVSCIDGSCPVANRDEYAERGYDVIWDCDECWRYEGCKDCYIEGTEMCPNYGKDGGVKMPKSIKELVVECRKRGIKNGACVGYHDILFDEVADRLEGLARREEDIKAEAYAEVFKVFDDEKFTNLFPGSVVISKDMYDKIKVHFVR